MMTTLNLVAEMKDGKPVLEKVMVERLADNRFRLARSPGLVAGIAAGDEFEVSEDEPHGYRLVKRGGNICVQMFFPHDAGECRLALVPLAEQLRGRCDGETTGSSSSMLVFTFPLSAGLAAIEKLMERAKVVSPRCEWSYGNVYAESDGVTPLNWWLQE
jgi:hypothetical protein